LDLLIITLIFIVLVFLLFLVNKAFKHKSKDCYFKVSLSLIKGFTIEFSTNEKNAPPDKC